MAYLTYLAAVTTEDLALYRRGDISVMSPTFVSAASHLLAYWVTAQPLGAILQEAIDGGEVLRQDLWHPLRVPRVHPAPATARLYRALSDSLSVALKAAPEPIAPDDWYQAEIDRVRRTFEHAANHDRCVVSYLQPPADVERGSRVKLPIEVSRPQR